MPLREAELVTGKRVKFGWAGVTGRENHVCHREVSALAYGGACTLCSELTSIKGIYFNFDVGQIVIAIVIRPQADHPHFLRHD